MVTDYIIPEELARQIDIREETLKLWHRDGFAPPRTRLRQRVVYRREAVRAWLRTLEEEPTEAGADAPAIGPAAGASRR